MTQTYQTMWYDRFLTISCDPDYSLRHATQNGHALAYLRFATDTGKPLPIAHSGEYAIYLPFRQTRWPGHLRQTVAFA